jgi:hypothetical protein
MLPVSAWASKWITETLPQPTARATPVTFAEDQGHRSLFCHPLDDLLEGGARRGRVTGEHLDVARVADVEVHQTVGAQSEAGTGAVHGEVAGLPQRLRSEPCSGTRRGAAVERGTDDDHVGVAVGRGIARVARRHAKEGEVGTVLCAVPGHGRTLSLCGRQPGVGLPTSLIQPPVVRVATHRRRGRKVASNGKDSIAAHCRVHGSRSTKVCDIKINRKQGRVRVRPVCNDHVTARVKVVARYQPGRDVWKRTWRVDGKPTTSCPAPGNG